jgi:hypothetical protein
MIPSVNMDYFLEQISEPAEPILQTLQLQRAVSSIILRH